MKQLQKRSQKLIHVLQTLTAATSKYAIAESVKVLNAQTMPTVLAAEDVYLTAACRAEEDLMGAIVNVGSTVVILVAQ